MIHGGFTPECQLRPIMRARSTTYFQESDIAQPEPVNYFGLR
ncbi:hypothetical protein OKW21_001391 [Catalinimonas alkaloidigena]|nr:hypothetical protein [Catalinimonas alkaloidigena]